MILQSTLRTANTPVYISKKALFWNRQTYLFDGYFFPTKWAMIKSRQLPLSTNVSEPNYCFIDTRIREVKGLKLACIGREQCNPNYHVHRRGYSCLCLELVAKGSGKVTLGGKSFPLRPGMVFTYGPNVAHDITTLPEQPMLKYFVSFFGSESLPLLHRAGLPVGKAVQTLEMDRLRALFDNLLEEGSRHQAQSAEICASYLRILILKSTVIGGSSVQPVASSAITFRRCLKFIDEHYAELRTLKGIADRLHLRPPYLCRLFRQMGYPSPFLYLTRKKMARAAETLVLERKGVKETALALGYQDPYHFSRVFKAHFGLSPTQFVAAKLT